MKKRIRNILLAALMVVSLLPAVALADEPYSQADLSGENVCDDENGRQAALLETKTIRAVDLYGEPVKPGKETYEYKEDGIHVYSGDIVFSGKSDQKVFIEKSEEEDYFEIYFKDMHLENSVVGSDLSETVLIHMDASTIEGDVIAAGNGKDELYLCIEIENSNAIQGEISSAGSLTVYGWPDAVLQIKNAKAATMVYLSKLRLKNMQEEYKLDETLTITPIDISLPVTLAVKKEAVFPDNEEFVINGGKPFACGDAYEIKPPVVCDENGTAFAPQPELTVAYYKEILKNGNYTGIELLDGKPVNEGTYVITFYMPEDDPDYTGSHFYEFKISQAFPYRDVGENDYFYDAVEWAVQNEITKGTGENVFSPNAPVTRAQVVTFLWRAAGCPVVNDSMRMDDVKPETYYTEAVRWALSEGIAKGTGDATFSPDLVCTRGQIVTFLARFAGVADTDTASAFTDVKATDYFAAAVKWAKDNQVTEGTSATTFCPYDDCTRAQVVTFLWRWMVQ